VTTLQTTLDLATNVLNALANLINGAGGSTPIPYDENTPLPSYDESTDTWTIAQDTADTDGVYKGIYTFALNTACSIINISSVSGHSAPTGFPSARYTDCDDVVHDESTVMGLDGKLVKRFEIYSDTAFTIELTVAHAFCYQIDFTSPTDSDVSIAKGVQQANNIKSNFGSNPITGGSDTSVVILYNVPDNLVTTRIEIDYNRVVGLNPAGFASRVQDQPGTTVYYDSTNYLSGDQTIVLNDVTISNLRIILRSSFGDNSGEVTLKSVKIEGLYTDNSGTNPFGTSNC